MGKTYNKNSEEYVSTGRYFIDGTYYSSLYIYKTRHQLNFDNNPSQNRRDSITLSTFGVKSYECAADFSDKIANTFKIYPEDAIEEHLIKREVIKTQADDL